MKAPGSIIFEGDEVERINDAQLVIRGVCRWDEVDNMPMAVRNDLLAVMMGEDAHKAHQAKKRQTRGVTRGRRH